MNKNNYIIISFYKFTELSKINEIKIKFRKLCISLKVKGLIILANEGVNLGVSLPIENKVSFINYLYSNFKAKNNDIKTYSYDSGYNGWNNQLYMGLLFK